MRSYIFHVSLPDTGRAWRKVELTSDQTLEDLHYAIQTAYGWGADHLYSFFMSGEAWDAATEYSLPEGADPFGLDLEDDEWDEDEEGDEWSEDEEGDDEPDEEFEPPIDDEAVVRLRATLGDQPPPQSLSEMLSLVETNEELRGQLAKLLSEQTGMPTFMMNMMLSNAGSLLKGLPEGMLDDLFGPEPEPGDVRTTTLDELDLQVGKTFMYLFDYGDEWRFKVRVHAINDEADPAATYPRIVESVGEAPEQYPDWEEDEEEDEWEEDDNEEDEWEED